MYLDFYGGFQIYMVLWAIWGCAAGVETLAAPATDASEGADARALARRS
jgi:hypothetical protein